MSLRDDCIPGRETIWIYVDPFQVDELLKHRSVKGGSGYVKKGKADCF